MSMKVSMSSDFTGSFSRKEWIERWNKKLFMVGDSVLNNISERGISKQHSVKVRNFPGATTKNKLRY